MWLSCSRKNRQRGRLVFVVVGLPLRLPAMPGNQECFGQIVIRLTVQRHGGE
jgi:hypothetical protein